MPTLTGIKVPKASASLTARERRKGRSGADYTFYHSMTWRRLRNLFIQANLDCAECERQGRLTPATVVDHIIPIRLGGEPLDESNLAACCTPCHARKSQRERLKK